MRLLALVITLTVAAAQAAPAVSPLEEQRYCGEPKRDAAGRIQRRSDVLAAFRRAHPCPVTGLSSGACAGWAIDHVIPLACGGCDAVSNLQWLPNALKSAPVTGKDRFERKIYWHADGARAGLKTRITTTRRIAPGSLTRGPGAFCFSRSLTDRLNP